MITKRAKIKRGSVLVLAVIMVVILLIIGLAMITMGQNARLQTIRSQLIITAKTAADAGLSDALYKMNAKRRNDIALYGAWNNGGALPLASTPISLNSDSGQAYIYDVNGNAGIGFTMTATGNVNAGQVHRSVQGTLTLKNPFSEGALLVKEKLEIQNMVHVAVINTGGSEYDHVRARIGSASGTRIGGEQPVQIGNNGNINGDIVVGVGGNPTDLTSVGNKTDVTGKVYAMPDEVPFDVPVIPSDLLLAATSGGYATNTISTFNATNSGKYDSITLTQNGAGLSIVGDVKLYVLGDITTGPQCSIIINPGSTLAIYIDGNFKTWPGNDVNFVNLTGIAGNFHIYGTNPVSQTIDIWPKMDFCGAINAPNANIDVKPKGAFVGGIICKNLSASNNFSFTYDKALAKVTIDDSDAWFAIKRWTEW